MEIRLSCDFHKIINRFAMPYFIIVMEVCLIMLYSIILLYYVQQQFQLSG